MVNLRCSQRQVFLVGPYRRIMSIFLWESLCSKTSMPVFEQGDLTRKSLALFFLTHKQLNKNGPAKRLVKEKPALTEH